jgi:UDP-N-acetylmuramoyl-L-alanyl-D-glutamate--2,6-diaminopimelate ligase
MEASSHGLDQRRLDGVRLAAGAFTNLTRDHLDYHRTLEAYRAAKLRLFDTLLAPGAAAVVNADSKEAAVIAAIAEKRGLRLFTAGRDGRESAIARSRARRVPGNSRRPCRRQGSPHQISAHRRVSDFQCADCRRPGDCHGHERGRCAGGAGVVARRERAARARRRQERRAGFRRLRPHARCAGDRARCAAALCETPARRVRLRRRPRSRQASADGRDRGAACGPRVRDRRQSAQRRSGGNPPRHSGRGARRGGNRQSREAIKTAVAELAPGDVLLVAGKGHETGQIVGDRILPFSDQAEVRAALGMQKETP